MKELVAFEHRYPTRVSFGDCDPAGIVFYPNILAWFDRAFHDRLWRHGGHEALCERLGAIGIGLMGVEARFLKPMRNGDALSIDLSVEEWGEKAFRIAYAVRRGGSLTATGQETRGLFLPGPAGIIAGRIDLLREALESDETRQS